jgi:excisionase family DNA binding protein
MSDQPDPSDLLTVREYAAAVGLTTASVYRNVASGAVPVVRIGRGIRIPRSALTPAVQPRLRPLSPEARAVVARAVDEAPPLSAATITELRVLLGTEAAS